MVTVMAQADQARAEMLFPPNKSPAAQFFVDKAKADKARVEHVAKLRNLRLTKEAEDQAEAAANTTPTRGKSLKKRALR